MKTQIDKFDSTTGWTLSNGTIALRDNEEFIASYHSNCLLFNFSGAGSASKTFSPAIALLPTLSFSIVADSDLGANGPALSPLKVKFFSGANSVEYFVPANGQFNEMEFWNNSATGALSTIDKIQFTTTAAVQFFVSDFLTFKDQFPFDTYTALSQIISQNITSSEETVIGTLSNAIGARRIRPSSLDYYDKGLVFQVGTKTHKILDLDQVNGCTLDKDFDGPAMLENNTSAPVYVKFPILIEPNQYSGSFPGIYIGSSFDAEPAEQFELYSPLIDSYRTDGYCRARVQGKTWKHTVTVQGQARVSKLNEILLLILKKTFNDKNIIYINGRRHEIFHQGVQWLDFGNATDILSRMQVDIEIYVTEESWLQELQTTQDLNLTWTTNRILPP
jgi:hypothetical protein